MFPFYMGEFFQEMGLLLSMFNPPHSILKSFYNNLALVLGTIRLSIKIGNKDDKYNNSEETFYVSDAPLGYNAIVSIEWHHKMSIVL